MNSRTKKTTNRTPKPETRDAYVSFNRDEWTALQKLGFRERWAYMQFKWLANFKTGTVGNFRKQCLTYQDIANLVAAPGVQGRGMGGIDDTQASEFLQRMEAVGLVAGIGRRANRGLLFELPLSPINRKASVFGSQNVVRSAEPEPISPVQTVPQTAISPTDDIPPFDEIPASTRDCTAPTLSLSVLALTKSKNNTEAAGAATADAAPPSRATGAAPIGNVGEAQAEPSAPLTTQEIRNVLANSWTFRDIDTPEAWQLYESWSFSGITTQNLHAAMTSLEESDGDQDLTPATLTPLLIPSEFDAWLDRQAA